MATSVEAAAVNDDLIEALRAIVAGRLSTARSVLDQHGRDESYHRAFPPDVVVFPETTEEVSRIVKVCAGRQVPIIPYGTGTSLEGHIAALRGGVCIDLGRMNNIIAVNDEDLDVIVEAGVTREQLNRHLSDRGLFFPIDPGADASLGGMAATRASGTNAVRYGTMREGVLALCVVMADGRVIRTSRRARKSAAGYDLTRLFVGSEGTLGVITEVTLRLHGIPDAISSAVVSFPTMEGAVATVIATIQMGVPIARIELLDDVQMDAINKYSGLDYPVQSTLFLEFHGTQAGVAEQAEQVEEICQDQGGGDFKWAVKVEDRNKLWKARHMALYAALAMRPGARAWTTDVCVPISRLAECIAETKKDLAESPLMAPLVGHAGDGNFHLVFLINPEKEDEMAEARRLNERLVMRALAMEGTCAGEHGIGYGKMDFLTAEHGEAMTVMRAVKQALDPDNIMNPGKIIKI